MKGSYSLIMETPEKAEIGGLGEKNFGKRFAVYNGSAFGPGGLKRVLRHFSSEKKIHWHIDHLLKKSRLKIAVIFPGEDLECSLSSKMTGEKVQGFGSSDCSCDSHLIQYDSLERIFSDLPPGVKVMDRDRYNRYKNAENNEAIDDLVQGLPDAETYQSRRDL